MRSSSRRAIRARRGTPSCWWRRWSAYAVSPIDLIPDFIPVLGQLDDLLLLPIGIALAIRLVPRAVLEEKRAQAAARFGGER